MDGADEFVRVQLAGGGRVSSVDAVHIHHITWPKDVNLKIYVFFVHNFV